MEPNTISSRRERHSSSASIATMDIDAERLGLMGVDGGGRRRHPERWSGARVLACALACLALIAGAVGVSSNGGIARARAALGVSAAVESPAFFGNDGQEAMLGDASAVKEKWMKEQHDWRVVSFASKNYDEIGKLWYRRLQKLGYKNHYLVALDDQAYEEFHKMKFRVVRAPRFTLKGDGDLSGLWRYRLEYILQEVKRGQNVLLSDLDVMFAHNYDPAVVFNKVGDEDVDIFHSLGAGWPKSAKEKWGFSLCLGFSAFKATTRTQFLLEAVVQVCKNERHCDDQATLNELYMKYLQMSWTPTADHGERKGVSRNTLLPLTVKTISSLVPRVDVQKMKSIKDSEGHICYGHLHHSDGEHWAVAPIVAKDGAAKVKVWQEFHNMCFPAPKSGVANHLVL